MKSREIQSGFAQGLGGEGSRVGRRTAVEILFFDERDFFTEISRLCRPLFPSGSRTYHNEIIVHGVMISR